LLLLLLELEQVRTSKGIEPVLERAIRELRKHADLCIDPDG
jgi:hypothetical protein